MKAEPPIGARRRQRPSLALVVGEETKEEEINRERPWRSPHERPSIHRSCTMLMEIIGETLELGVIARMEVDRSAIDISALCARSDSDLINWPFLLRQNDKVPQMFTPATKHLVCVGTLI